MGYHQIELHPDSRYITTFSTRTGLKRYKRLNFEIHISRDEHPGNHKEMKLDRGSDDPCGDRTDKITCGLF